MTTLTSTVPGAFTALYNLLLTQGNTQTPVIPVFYSDVPAGSLTQNGYVILDGVENHSFKWAAFGSFAQYEYYDICGRTVYYQGGPDVPTMAQDVMSTTWSIYTAVVMETVVANWGNAGPVLGSSAPAALEMIEPAEAAYSAQQGDVGGISGWQGCVEFRYSLQARISVA